MIEKLTRVNRCEEASQMIYKNIAQLAWDEYGQDLSEEDKKEIFEQIVSKYDHIGDFLHVYKKYYEAEDVLNLIAFYKTKTGQKFLESQPQIVQDLMGLMAINTADFINEITEEIKKRS